jgi:hypothetical protein
LGEEDGSESSEEYEADGPGGLRSPVAGDICWSRKVRW